MYRSPALVLACALPAAAASAEPTDLNTTRIALFSSGVGYFERTANITGTATAELRFRTDQINDILKSMVVQDFGGGKVGVVTYASQDPIEKTLRSFGVNLTDNPTLAQLLDQLRGEPVTVTGPVNLTGAIIGVESVPVVNPDGQTLTEVQYVTLHTEKGMQRLELAKIQSIALQNEKVDEELRKALRTLASAHDADKKSVSLSFEGAGPRNVRVAYLLETPIWKTSYRLVLSDDKKPFLQGWATVENATEEDWKDVRLSLVSGRPISFRMDLYTPLYVPRPLEQLEIYASLRPPQYEGGFGGESEASQLARAAQPPGVAGARSKRADRGRGDVLTGAAPAAPPAGGYGLFQAGGGRSDELPGLALSDAGVASVAIAEAAGELFAYHIDTPVTLARQHSALLPIVNQEIEATKVSIFNAATHPKHPLNGLELRNTTGLNLVQGPVTLFDGNLYAGDAKLPDLRPDEKRLLAYALDLSTEVLLKANPVPEEIVSLRVAKGTLIHRRRYVDEREYTLKNKDAKDRTIILEQPVSPDWNLVEPKEPYERTASLLRFKTTATGSKESKFKVRLERVGDQYLTLSDAGFDQIEFYLRTKVITPKVKEALQQVIKLRTELGELTKRRERLEKESGEAVAEQGRIRENLKTLDKNTDAYQRQLAKFDALETQIGKLREDVAAARSAEEQGHRNLETYLLGLELE